MPISPGLRAEIENTVSDTDTAQALGSGDVPVLATPRLVAWCESASILALGDALDAGRTSVGMRVQFEHVAPSAVGATIRTESILEKVEGRRLTFTVSVRDGGRLVAAGKVTRAVVDRDEFLAKLD